MNVEHCLLIDGKIKMNKKIKAAYKKMEETKMKSDSAREATIKELALAAKTERLKSGVKIEQMSRDCGVSKSFLSRCENGKSVFPKTIINQYAKIL